MSQNFVTYMKLMYELFKNNINKYDEMQVKVRQWIELNKNKVDGINKKLRDEIDKREKFLNAFKRPDTRVVLREFNEFEYSDLEDTYYKVALDSLNLHFFDLSPNDFFRFVAKTNPLTEEQLQAFLSKNNSEEGRVSIKQYLAGLGKAPDLNQRMECHWDFFYSLKRKIQGEDAETSNLMAAAFLYHLVNKTKWFLCIESDEVEESICDMACLFVKNVTHLHLHPHVIDFIDELFPMLEEKANAYKYKGLVPLAEQEKMMNSMLSHFIHSLYSRPLMKFFLKIHALTVFVKASINFDLTMTELGENKQLITLPWNGFQGEREIEKSPDIDQMVLFNVLKMVDDKAILTMLLNKEVFIKINKDLLDEDNAVKVVDAFCAATNKDTKGIWKAIPFPLLLWFFKINDQECTKVADQYPDLESYIFVRSFMSLYIEHLERFAYLVDRPHDICDSRQPDDDSMMQNCMHYIKNLFKSLLAHIDYVPSFCQDNAIDLNFVRDFIVLLLTLSGCNAGVKNTFNEVITAIDTISKTEAIDNIFLSEAFFFRLSKVKGHIRKMTFSSSNFVIEEYKKWEAARKQELSVNKPVLSEAQVKKNKEWLASVQKNASNQATPSLDAKKPSKSSRRKKKKAQQQPVKQTLIKLNEAEQKDFIHSLSASLAGDAQVVFKWIDGAEDEAGYFKLNFADVGHEFQAQEKIGKNPQKITLADDAREKFLTQYLPVLFHDHLSDDVSLSVKDDGLCITPKKDRCAYPDKMLSASWHYLTKHGTLAENDKAKSLSIENQTATLFKARRQNYHYSGLGQPTSSLTSGQHQDAINATSQMTPQAPSQPIDIIKSTFREIVFDALPDKGFNFITLKQAHNQFVITVNLKGAPCLSGHDKQMDTYVVMKSIVMALQAISGKGFSITPDELNSEARNKKSCEISITAKGLKNMAATLTNPAKLRELFNEYLAKNNTLVNCYETVKKLNQEAQGANAEIMINESEQIKEKVCQSFQRLTVPKEYVVCLDELFDELKKLNELSAQENLHPCVLKGIESAKFICYHRVFHNLTWLFEGKGDRNNAVFTRTMRDAFRHGYLEMPPGFMEVIDELMTSLMNHEKDTSIQFANPNVRHVSFNLTQTLYGKFVAKISSFIQMKSNHTIGDTTIDDRQAEIPQLKAAITYMESVSSFNQPLKQSMIVAMMSRIGELEKVEPYAKVYGRLGTHDKSLTISPDQLNKEIFDLIETLAQGKSCRAI